jgi:hypothetical protein
MRAGCFAAGSTAAVHHRAGAPAGQSTCRVQAQGLACNGQRTYARVLDPSTCRAVRFAVSDGVGRSSAQTAPRFLLDPAVGARSKRPEARIHEASRAILRTVEQFQMGDRRERCKPLEAHHFRPCNGDQLPFLDSFLPSPGEQAEVRMAGADSNRRPADSLWRLPAHLALRRRRLPQVT